MEATMNTDVVIIGAGPTGLSLACQFVRHGIDFAIFDKSEGITPYSKAIGVQARTLEIYDQIGLAQGLIAQGTIAERVSLIEAGKVRGKIELANIGKGLSPYPFLLIVEQSKHEHLLYDFLKTGGKDVFWQAELESFWQTDGGVTAKIRNAKGESQTVEAKYLVGCDGAKSLVRHALGMTFEGITFDRLFYVADVQIGQQFSHDEIMVCLAQNTFTAFFPLPGEKRFRIVGTFPENTDKNEGEILYEEIEEQIKEDTKLELDITKVNWFSIYKVHSRRVSKFSEGRCFFAGDAAHVHTPAGAQGMNTGIQDGYNLAWKLASVIKGFAGTHILETYDEERGENAKHLLETTDRLFEFGASPEWFIAYFRTLIFPLIANVVLSFDIVKKIVFPLVSQIGINYRHSSLSEHADDAKFKVKAGDRMPYFLVDNESIYDRLSEPKFHLLTFSGGGSGYQTMKGEIEKEYPYLVDYYVVPFYDPRIKEVFGMNKSFSVLLRPDNYIGFISQGTLLDKLRVYLNEHIKQGNEQNAGM